MKITFLRFEFKLSLRINLGRSRKEIFHIKENNYRSIIIVKSKE